MYKKKYSNFMLASLCIIHIMEASIGYLDIGYGTKARGMGGVATAFPQDSLVAATNPAGMIWVGNRIDIGSNFFSPARQTTTTNNNVCETRKSNSNVFLIPHAGINKLICEDISFGCSFYGNGGMNTNYPCNFTRLFGQGPLGVNLMQLIAAPTMSQKINKNHSIGISPLGGIQVFKAKGLQNFANPFFSQSPCNVTNRAHLISPGLGLRVGWMGKFGDHINLGFAYSTKIYTKQFELYKGLFAQEGSFDIPANLSAGIAFENINSFTAAFDFQYIFYGDVPSIANSIAQLGLPFNPMMPMIQNKLGSPCGPGFGWQNIPVYKLGLAYDGFDCTVLRLGYNHCQVPFSPLEIDFNIISPAVIKDHVTCGLTIELDEKQSLDFAFMWAFKNKVKGQSQFGLGCVELQMWQYGLEANYGVKF